METQRRKEPKEERGEERKKETEREGEEEKRQTRERKRKTSVNVYGKDFFNGTVV